MGMDSYIYKSSKDEFEKYKKQKLKIKELRDKAINFINSLHKKYGIKDEWSREILEVNCTKEEVNLADSYIAEWRNETDAREDIFSEEFYWRKPYGLHQFITQKFLNIGENDNCVHIPLSKENIETIINELKSNPSFFENSGMWDSDDTVDAIKCFTKLLNEYSDDVVITYYSWY